MWCVAILVVCSCSFTAGQYVANYPTWYGRPSENNIPPIQPVPQYIYGNPYQQNYQNPYANYYNPGVASPQMYPHSNNPTISNWHLGTNMLIYPMGNPKFIEEQFDINDELISRQLLNSVKDVPELVNLHANIPLPNSFPYNVYMENGEIEEFDVNGNLLTRPSPTQGAKKPKIISIHDTQRLPLDRKTSSEANTSDEQTETATEVITEQEIEITPPPEPELDVDINVRQESQDITTAATDSVEVTTTPTESEDAKKTTESQSQTDVDEGLTTTMENEIEAVTEKGVIKKPEESDKMDYDDYKDDYGDDTNYDDDDENDDKHKDDHNDGDTAEDEDDQIGKSLEKSYTKPNENPLTKPPTVATSAPSFKWWG